jgi:toxin ParE1/3/4
MLPALLTLSRGVKSGRRQKRSTARSGDSPVVFRLIARDEFDAAVAWYERERFDLGLEFKSAIDRMLAAIARHPGRFRKIRGGVRRAVLKRFPHAIHFLDEDARIVVLAVFHASRDPSDLRKHEYSTLTRFLRKEVCNFAAEPVECAFTVQD